MATIGTGVMTLSSWAKTIDPDGKPAKIVELLNQNNAIMEDIPWMEGNEVFGHRTTVRTGLPAPVWRLLNQGVTPTSSTSAQIVEQIGMLEDWINVDKDLAELNGNTAEFRLQEAKPHFEAMSQEMASTFFYGNSGTAPEEFTGLATRYSSSTALNGQNVIKAGGSQSDNASIWLVGWGENTVHGIFPRGSKMGLIHEDLGLQTVQTGTGITGGLMRAYQDHFQWKGGLCLKDWRYAVRVCNIDISNLVAESSNADLLKAMVRAVSRLPSLNNIKPVFYVNRTVQSWLNVQAMSKTNVNLVVGQEEGKPKTSLYGIPIKVCDALLESEATVS